MNNQNHPENNTQKGEQNYGKWLLNSKKGNLVLWEQSVQGVDTSPSILWQNGCTWGTTGTTYSVTSKFNMIKSASYILQYKLNDYQCRPAKREHDCWLTVTEQAWSLVSLKGRVSVTWAGKLKTTAPSSGRDDMLSQHTCRSQSRWTYCF